MENASKALIMAGGVLISVMIIAVAVYVFGKGKNFSNSTNAQFSEVEIQSFNAKFSAYITDADWTEPSVTDANRYDASSSLNKISDVISAANLAASVNYQNNNGYSYSQLEIANAVEFILDLTGSDVEGFKKYYLIEPNPKVEQNYVYGVDYSLDTTREARISNFNPESNKTNCNEFLKNFAESKLVNNNNKKYTIYKYYFKGEATYNKASGKIDAIKFTLIKDTNYASI